MKAAAYQHQRSTFETMRTQLLERMLAIMAVASIPIIGVLFFRGLHEGWSLDKTLHLIAYVLFLLLVIVRRHLPYIWCAALFLGLWWFSASVTLFSVGLGSDAKSILIVISMLAMFLLPLRAGISLNILGALTIGAVGIAVLGAGWQLTIDYSQRLQHPISWAFSAYNLSLFSGIAGYTVWFMVNTLRMTLEQSQEHAQQLDKALDRQKAIFAATNAAIGIIKERVFIDINEHLAQLLGYTRSELIGHPTRSVHVDELHYEKFGQLVSAQLSSGGQSSLEYPFMHRNGHHVWAYLSISTYEDGIALLGVDITELRQARVAAESANRAKTTFLANMSHELRTPLNAVLGFAQLLATAPNLDERQYGYIKAIHQGGDHLLALIDDILDLAKIEDDRVVLSPSNWSPKSVFSDLIRLFRVRADEKGIELNLEVQGDLPEVFHSDVRHLRQVLMNLLGNAIKFTNHGIVKLRVAFASGRLWVEVTDSGIGIAPEDTVSVFERFRQVGPETYKGQGAGLGLCISKRLVEVMGGGIQVQSTLGVGSRFYFDLPVDVATTIDIRNDSEVETNANPEIARNYLPAIHSPRRVLVVDDAEPNRMLLRAILEAMGLHVDEAEDGDSCLQQISNAPPDAIIMDMRMPGMDGLDATQQARELGFLGPVIMVSASAHESNRIASKDAGCQAYLSKPIVLNDLLSALRDVGLISQLPQEEKRQNVIKQSSTDIKLATHQAVINQELLEMHRQAIPVRKFIQILREFELSSKDYLESLIDTIREKRLTDAQRAAHRLAGSAGMLGLVMLEAICDVIESSIVTMNTNQLLEVTERLSTAYDITIKSLRKYYRAIENSANESISPES